MPSIKECPAIRLPREEIRIKDARMARIGPQRRPHYRVVQMETLHRIAWLCMSQGQQALPFVDAGEDFRQHPAYQEGFLTDEPDLSLYDETPPQDRTIDEG